MGIKDSSLYKHFKNKQQIFDTIVDDIFPYHMPIKCWKRRLTPVIPIQQLSPKRIGFPPVCMSFTMLVCIPIAAIAIIMKNLLNSFNG